MIFVYFFGFLLVTAHGQSYDETQRTLDRTLTALKDALDFFGEEYDNVNLDAIIGTRIVDGQFAVLLRRIGDGQFPEIATSTVLAVHSLRKLANEVSNKAMAYVKKNEPDYYTNIGDLLQEGFWQLDYPSRDIDVSLIKEPLYRGESMNEDQSDECLTEYFGTGKNKAHKCRISDNCWSLMTSPGYRKYSLSHEVFYLEIGEMFKCFNKTQLQYNDALNGEFCANILAEATNLAENHFESRWRDLFMEQAALCGMLGYQQFFKEDWLENILSWQRQRGCFGENAEYKHSRHTSSGDSRVKREEKELPDGCMCHRTAVAISALSQYVRYVMEFMNTLHQAQLHE